MLDGKYYHTDLTWNDQGLSLYHAYFNVTDSVIGEDHVISETAYALPSCTATDSNYFVLYGGLLSGDAYSKEKIAERLLENDLKASFYINGDTESFKSFMRDNISDIARMAGVSGSFSYIYTKLGREMIYEIILCKHEILTKIPKKEPKCTEEGNIEYFLCECGRFFDSADATNEIRDLKDVTIYPKSHDYSEKIEKADYQKSAGTCVKAYEYYYACKECGISAGKDPYATDKFYTGSRFGSHFISEALESDGRMHYYACKNEGCSHREGEESCFGGTPSCTSAARCDACGNLYGEALPHKFNTDAYEYTSIDGHAHMCLDCDAHAEIAEHIYDSQDDFCSVCGYEKPENAAFAVLERLGIPREYHKTVLISAVSLLGIIVVIAFVAKKRR